MRMQRFSGYLRPAAEIIIRKDITPYSEKPRLKSGLFYYPKYLENISIILLWFQNLNKL